MAPPESFLNWTMPYKSFSLVADGDNYLAAIREFELEHLVALADCSFLMFPRYLGPVRKLHAFSRFEKPEVIIFKMTRQTRVSKSRLSGLGFGRVWVLDTGQTDGSGGKS